MVKVFISQPMRGKSDEEIRKTRDKIKRKVRREFKKNNIDEKIVFISSFIKGAGDDKETINAPVYYLGKTIQMMSEADLVVFTPDFEDARGCTLEYMVALQYGLSMLVLS